MIGGIGFLAVERRSWSRSRWTPVVTHNIYLLSDSNATYPGTVIFSCHFAKTSSTAIMDRPQHRIMMA
jgi:hypothetical protein